MKFLVTYRWDADAKKRDEGLARFLKTGGQVPKGVRLLGRWTRVDLSGGICLVESDDPRIMGEFSYQWSDLMELAISPVLDDENLVEVLKRATQQNR
jgi:hypothetical protein